MRNKSSMRSNCVYFIGYRDPIYKQIVAVKVGETGDVDRRMADLQQAIPGEVILLCTIPTESKSESRLLEKHLHTSLDKANIRLEWFHYTDNIKWLVEFIKESPADYKTMIADSYGGFWGNIVAWNNARTCQNAKPDPAELLEAV